MGAESFTRTETRWDMFGELPVWPSIGLLVFTVAGGWLLGRRLGLRTPGAWLPVWIFELVMAKVAAAKHSSLAGWLVLFGLAGFACCAWLTVRRWVPVLPQADERRGATTEEPAPARGGGYEHGR